MGTGSSGLQLLESRFQRLRSWSAVRPRRLPSIVVGSLLAGFVVACSFNLPDVREKGLAGASGDSGFGGTSGSGGANAGTGGVGGTSGSTGNGGQGTGGSLCNLSDFCQSHGYPSGFYCDGSTRLRCGKEGECFVAEPLQNCPAGCENGLCNATCAENCQGWCGQYGACDCGPCSNGECINFACQSCSDLCSGKCGYVKSCHCSDCTLPKVCSQVLGVCADCQEGNTQSASCQLAGTYCHPSQSQTCSSGVWGPPGECLDQFKYYGDNTVACGDAVCVTFSGTGTDQMIAVTVSKKTGLPPFDVQDGGGGGIQVIFKDGQGNTVFDSGCWTGVAGKYAETHDIDATKLGLSVGDNMRAVDVVSPCFSAAHHLSEVGTISQCKQ